MAMSSRPDREAVDSEQAATTGDAAVGTNSRVARLLIADDHELARAGLRAMLAAERDSRSLPKRGMVARRLH